MDIQQPGEVPMGIASIYRLWQTPDGRDVFTMAMLSVNADDHPLMKRFHKPGDEKRMVVILDPEGYSRWLSCGVEQAFFVERSDLAQKLALANLPPTNRSVAGPESPAQKHISTEGAMK